MQNHHQRWNLVILDFYDPKDRQKGFIAPSIARGNHEWFPTMNLFISVVTDEHRTGSYLGDVSALPQS